MSQKLKIIASFNNKGGVAKTTYAALLGLHLAKEGNKVLLVDADPQSNLTTRLYAYTYKGLTLGDLLLNEDTIPMKEGIVRGFLSDYPTLDLIPGNKQMKFFEELLISKDKTEDRDTIITRWLVKNVETINEYDYIIYDLSPSTSIAGRNIINSCDSILFVSEYNNIDSIEAVSKFLDDLKDYKKRKGYPMPNYAVLINKFKRAGSSVEIYEKFESFMDDIQDNILKTRMIESDVIRNNSLCKKDIISYTEELKLNKKAMKLFIDIINELKERGII